MKAIKEAKERGEWKDDPNGAYEYNKPKEGEWPPKKKPTEIKDEKKDKDVATFA